MTSKRLHILGNEESSRDDLLDDYVRRSEEASVYHCSRWRTIIRETCGHGSFWLFSTNAEGAVDGILPLVHLKSVLFGNMLVSMPYFNYGGVCADEEGTETRLIEEAARIARRVGARHIEFRQEKRLNHGLPVKTAKVSMRRDLPATPDDLWESLPSKLRSQVRRPLKEGMTCRIGRTEELDGFYDVFATNMRDLGTPVYAKRFFRNILDGFPDNSWICSIYKGRMPVASGFLIGFKGRMEIPWASSLKRYNRLSPNMLLYWSCLRFSCERGFRVFDFGRSTPDEGTYRFKEQWGAKPVPLYWHYWLPDGEPMPQIHPKNEKYRIAIRCWKRLPVGLTKRIGPWLVKKIP